MKKLRTLADLRREAQALVAAGDMPTFADVLKAVVDARREYRAKVRFGRLKKARRIQ